MSEIELITEDYKIGLGHYSAFYRAWQRRLPFPKVKAFLVVTATVATLGMALSLFWPLLGNTIETDRSNVLRVILVVTGLLTTVAAAAFYTVVIFVVLPLISYLLNVVLFLVSPKRRPTQKVTISNREICKTSNLGDAVYDWRSLQDIVETKTALLFFTAKNSALIIPKSAFCSQAAAYHFVTLSQTLSAQARRAA